MSRQSTDSGDTASTVAEPALFGRPVYDISGNALRFGQLVRSNDQVRVVPVFIGVLPDRAVKIEAYGNSGFIQMIYPRWHDIARLEQAFEAKNSIMRHGTVPVDGWRMLEEAPLGAILSIPVPPDATVSYDVAEITLRPDQVKLLADAPLAAEYVASQDDSA
jgi:hypothetical protein